MPLPDDDPIEGAVYDTPAQFEPFDPEAIPPTSGPALSNIDVPGAFGDTSGDDGEPLPGPGTKEHPSPTFDPRLYEPLRGLLFIGALASTFTWLGHTFSIRTLRTEELAEIAVVTRRYRGTKFEIKAEQCAVIAGAVQSVDGHALPGPLTMADGDTLLVNRFAYVMKNWYAPVIDKVYEEYLGLEMQVREIITEMGNQSG